MAEFIIQLLSVSLHKLIIKMKTGIIVDFIFQGYISRSNHQHMFRKVLIKCRENVCEGFLL